MPAGGIASRATGRPSGTASFFPNRAQWRGFRLARSLTLSQSAPQACLPEPEEPEDPFDRRHDRSAAPQPPGCGKDLAAQPTGTGDPPTAWLASLLPAGAGWYPLSSLWHDHLVGLFCPRQLGRQWTHESRRFPAGMLQFGGRRHVHSRDPNRDASLHHSAEMAYLCAGGRHVSHAAGLGSAASSLTGRLVPCRRLSPGRPLTSAGLPSPTRHRWAGLGQQNCPW